MPGSIKGILLKINTIVIILITSLVPLFVLPDSADYFYYPKICVIYFLIAAALIVNLILYFKGLISIRLSREFIPLAVFALFVVVSTIFSPYIVQAILGREFRKEGLLTYISYFLILFFCYNYAYQTGNIKTILFPLLVSSSLISIYGILQYFGIDPIPRDPARVSWTFSSFSTLGNPDFLGSYLSMTFPLSLSLYLLTKDKLYPLFFYICTVLSYGALICTQARSAWIGVIFSLAVMLVLFIRSSFLKNIKLYIFIVSAVIITILLNSVHNGAISSKFSTLADDYKKIISSDSREKSTAGSQRVFIWSRTMNYLFDRPILGSGPDTFDRVFQMSSEEAEFHFGSKIAYVDKAHNEYLQIAITLGLPALFAYLIFLFMVAFKSISFIRKGNCSKYTICLFFGFLAYITQAFFNISVVSVAPVFWSLLGLLIGTYKKVPARVYTAV